MIPFIVALLLGLSAGPAYAGFGDGLAAYDAGDLETAIAEWKSLAEAGDSQAQVALAGLYLTAHGRYHDISRAVRWYRKAAEQGNAVAQLNLGDLYGKGLGVERDLGQAYFWLTLAAVQGRRWAERQRRELAQTMTPADRRKAERMLEEWRQNPLSLPSR